MDPAKAVGPMRLVLSAFPDATSVQRIVEGVLARRLAACASSWSVESRYWWEEKREYASETLVLFKTSPRQIGALFEYLSMNHPYEVPEILELDVARVQPSYLKWLLTTTQPGFRAHRSDRRRVGLAAKRLEGLQDPGAPLPVRTRGRHHRPSRRIERHP